MNGVKANAFKPIHIEMPENRIIITVDGLAGSGKSSLAAALAAKTGFALLNSGLLYRGLAYLSRLEKVAYDDVNGLKSLLKKHKMELDIDSKGECALFIDAVNLTHFLRTVEVSETSSLISQLPMIREQLQPLQRDAFPGRPMVAEGRDMGTVIFPDAKLKFFVETDLEVRIQRRMNQLGLSGPDGEAKVRKEVADRDVRDTQRIIAPAVAASDAVMIDNTTRSLTETVEAMYTTASSRGLV